MSRARIHASHDRPRLELTRQRDLEALPPPADRPPPAAPRRPHRALVRSLFADARAAAAQEGAGDARTVARTALLLFRAGRRELGAGGPSAIAALWSWALLTACAQSLTLAAARELLASDRGGALLERATAAQGRAERSWTAAVAASNLLGAKRRPARSPVLDGIEASAAAHLAAQQGTADDGSAEP